MTTTEPTPEAVEALACVVLPAMPNHCCPPGDLADCPWDAHDAGEVARAVLAAGYREPRPPRGQKTVVETSFSELLAKLTRAEDERNAALSILADVETLAEDLETHDGALPSMTLADIARDLRAALELESGS